MAFYQIMGISDAIAASLDDYVKIAVRIGTDRAYRSVLSTRINERSHLLWDRKGVVDEWAQFLEEAAQGKPITNLHTKRPTAPWLDAVGAPYTKL